MKLFGFKNVHNENRKLKQVFFQFIQPTNLVSPPQPSLKKCLISLDASLFDEKFVDRRVKLLVSVYDKGNYNINNQSFLMRA